MSEDAFRIYAAKSAPAIGEALKEALLLMPEPVRPVASHILEAGGKRLRPLLTALCAGLFGKAGSKVFLLGASMELLHAATLLHDDVLDNAASRRGCEAAHLVFGNAQAVLAGDAMLACGNAIIASFDEPVLSACYSEAIMQTMAGEIMEMAAIAQPDLQHAIYLEIARGKTACLIAQACELGALYAGARGREAEICKKFGENLGLAFQLIDDCLDFAPEEITGKPSGGDLREGKMTPPIRLYRESLNNADREKFDLVFAGQGFDEPEIKKMVSSVRLFLAQARALADPFLATARKCLADLPGGEANEILGQIVDYVGKRSR